MRHGLWSLWLWGLLVLRAHADDSYRLDGLNTHVSFEVQRYGMHWITAQFHDLTGEIVLNRADAASHVDVSVDTASVDCADAGWNERLRSAQWLDTQQFPHMMFHSHQVEFERGRALARGELSLHGITHPVTLEVSELHCAEQGGSQSVCRFVAHARVRRSDYGLPHGIWMGGDEVNITLVDVGVHVPTGARAAILPR